MHTFMFLTRTFTALEVIQGPAANSVNQSPSILASLGLTNEVMAVATMGRGIQAIVARCRCMQVQYAQGHATVSTPTDHLIPTPRPACLATKKRILKLSHDCYYTQTYIQSTRSQSTNNNAITRGHRDGAGMYAQLQFTRQIGYARAHSFRMEVIHTHMHTTHTKYTHDSCTQKMHKYK